MFASCAAAFIRDAQKGTFLKSSEGDIFIEFRHWPTIQLPCLRCPTTFRVVTTPTATPNPNLRADGRLPEQLRPIRFVNHVAPYASGSTLVEWGNTRVICGVTIEESVPRWMKEQ